jgi:hypothetical protein
MPEPTVGSSRALPESPDEGKTVRRVARARVGPMPWGVLAIFMRRTFMSITCGFAAFDREAR